MTEVASRQERGRRVEQANRVAALYDIHGNLPALDAVLAAVDAAAADLIVVGGDVATGPFPAETIVRLMALGGRARFVRGNADRELVAHFDKAEEPNDEADDPIAALSRWAARQITRSQRDFLAGFADRVAVDVAGLGPVLFCHGSPRGDEEIITAATPESRLRPMFADVAEDLIVCGHTHMQFDRVAAGKRAVNAGSVGMPYEGAPGAYWLLLGPGVSLQRTAYDFEAAATRIRATDYPGAEEFARGNVLAPQSPDEVTAYFERLAVERARKSSPDSVCQDTGELDASAHDGG